MIPYRSVVIVGSLYEYYVGHEPLPEVYFMYDTFRVFALTSSSVDWLCNGQSKSVAPRPLLTGCAMVSLRVWHPVLS
jgi:hypothetical protein